MTNIRVKPLSNAEILQAAIEKAAGPVSLLHCQNLIRENKYQATIFNHEFSKSFFGEECMFCPTRGHIEHTPAYIWHLMDMVTRKDPIKYLERFL